MSKVEYPQSYEQPWEGLHGRRWTGIGIVRGGNFDGADAWVESAGLAPRLPGESWLDWSNRTKGGQDLGSLSLGETINEQAAEEGTNGTE